MDNKLINKVIIWGADDVNTLGLVREMGESGVDFLFLRKGKAQAASQSCYVTESHEVSTNDEALSYLIETYKCADRKPIIITSGDGISAFINNNKDILEPYFIIPGCDTKGTVEKYTDKNTMVELARRTGIVCPDSRFVKWDSSLDGIVYPCIIKPSHQTGNHYNEFKFRICNNVAQLQKLLKNVRHESEFIVQSYIKAQEEVVVVGARMWDGKTILSGAIIRDRLTCGVSGHGYVTSNIPSTIDVAKIELYLEKIGYHGLFSFEYGIMDEKAYFYEVNLRNDGTTHCFYNAGAKLTLSYVYSSMGLDYSSINSTVTEDAWFIDELYDFHNVLEGRISYKRWKQDIKQASIYRYYDKNDIEPYKYLKSRRHIRICQYIILNRFRPIIVKILDRLGLRK